MVVTHNISEIDLLIFRVQHGNVGHDSKSGGIRLMYQIIQFFQIIMKCRTVTSNCNLVGNSPETDAWVVIILVNQLPHLRLTVFMSLRIAAHAGNEWNFSPYNESECITGIVKILTVLIVGQTDCVCTYFTDQFCIF